MPGKFKIVMSDLHLSAGRVAEGNPLEDFGSDQEFAALLDELIAESESRGAEVELIFNGDTAFIGCVEFGNIFCQKLYAGVIIMVMPPDHCLAARVDTSQGTIGCGGAGAFIHGLFFCRLFRNRFFDSRFFFHGLFGSPSTTSGECKSGDE